MYFNCKGISISPPSTHVRLGAFLGSHVHTESTDAISPNRIIGAKTCPRDPGT